MYRIFLIYIYFQGSWQSKTFLLFLRTYLTYQIFCLQCLSLILIIWSHYLLSIYLFMVIYFFTGISLVMSKVYLIFSLIHLTLKADAHHFRYRPVCFWLTWRRCHTLPAHQKRLKTRPASGHRSMPTRRDPNALQPDCGGNFGALLIRNNTLFETSNCRPLSLDDDRLVEFLFWMTKLNFPDPARWRCGRRGDITADVEVVSRESNRVVTPRTTIHRTVKH